MTFDDTLTDHEFADALRDAHADSFDAAASGGTDLDVDGLRHSLLSKLLAVFLPKRK